MDFVEFVKKIYRDNHDYAQPGALQRLGRSLSRAHDIGPLLEKNDPALDPFNGLTLAVMADAYREFTGWTEAAKSLRRHLAKNGLSLPDESRNAATTPGDLEALKRIASICGRSGHQDHDAWVAAVEAHVDLWKAAVNLTLAHGSVVVRIEEKDSDAAAFADLATERSILSEISGHQWLVIRSGFARGALSLELEAPLNEIARQTERRLPALGLVAEKLGPEELMKRLVASDLEPAILELLDSTAEKEALDAARDAYLALLGTTPLQADRIVSFYAESDNIGAAVLDKKGDVLEHASLAQGSDAIEQVADLIQKHEPTAVALPAGVDGDRFGPIEEATNQLDVVRVRIAAVDEARVHLPFEAAVSGAVVMGRRALKPGREWGRVNPMSLELCEQKMELDEEKIKRTLAEAKLISSWERRKQNQPTRRVSGSGRPARHVPVGKKLNPTIKTIRDLRPEMMVDGVVTNITRFGAFVNIGLATEGMIHVSQLAVEFVDDPSSVVKVGQPVKARVLEVIPEKERIALSLKPPVEHKEPDGQGGFRFDPAEKRQRQAPKTRSAALADLDALFKK